MFVFQNKLLNQGLSILILFCFIQNSLSFRQDNLGFGFGNIFRGKGNRFNGDFNTFIGNTNKAIGNSNLIGGDKNNVLGSDNLVAGQGNFVSGKGNFIASGKNKKDIREFKNNIEKQIEQKFSSLFQNNRFMNNKDNSYSNVFGPVLQQQSISSNSGLKRLQQMKMLTQNFKNNGQNFGFPFANIPNEWSNINKRQNNFISFNPFNGRLTNNFHNGFFQNQYSYINDFYPMNNVNHYGPPQNMQFSNLRNNNFNNLFDNARMMRLQNIFGRK